MAVEPNRFAGGDRKFFSIDKVGGLNTESPRSQIRNEQFSWLENLQPIADGNFRALYDIATAIYTTTPPRTIIYQYEFNIGIANYAFLCLDNGTAVQVNTDTNAVTTITSNTAAFYPGVMTLGTPLPQAAQFGQSGIVIVSTAQLGFSFWNGTTLFSNGTLGPNITITNPGAGYTTAPTVQISGGSGTGAAAQATVFGGQVTGITVTNPGSGYLATDPAPTVKLVGGQTSGSGASLTAVLSAFPTGSGAVLTPNWSNVGGSGGLQESCGSITITNGGTGYSAYTTATWTHPDGGYWLGPGQPAITLTIASGVITAVSFNTQNTWFNNNDGHPAIVVTDNGGGFFVSSVTGTPTGTNYSPSTTVTASGGGAPVTQATFAPTIVSGVITAVTVVNGGQYGTNTPPTLTETDTPVTATATAELMPFGVSGTCVETYAGRIWVGNGPVVSFNAPGGDVGNWASSQGAGSFTSNDSFLRREFTALKQSSGFLYLFADSSINVISNVQTGGSPVTTTFNNQNVDPEVGTPWHNAVQAMSEGLVFANVIGIFTLSGGNVRKISDEVDGTFIAATATLNADTAAQQPTSAVMTLNKKLVYMLVFPVQGPFDGSPRNAVIMWDTKRFWIGSQSVVPVSVGTQEVNSQIYAWINAGTTLSKMFTTKSGSLAKTWQTKLFQNEGPWTAKQLMRLYTTCTDNSSGGYSFTGTYDFVVEETSAVQTQAFTITTGNRLTGIGSGAANVRGNYLGMTLTTTKDDFTLSGMDMLYQEQSPMGG